MTFPPIIGFAGYARAGKNTAAEQLMKNIPDVDCECIGYADALKADLRKCVEWAMRHGINTDTPEFKEIMRPMYVLWSRVAKDIAESDLIWVNRLEKVIGGLRKINVTPLITDVRYHYEIESILAQGGMVFFINRNGIGPKNEEEANSFVLIEQRYKQMTIEYAVYNNGTKEELGQNVMKLLKLNLDSM
jgi:hypothetical protein